MSKFDDFIVNMNDFKSSFNNKVEDSVNMITLKKIEAEIESEIKLEYRHLGEKYYLNTKLSKEVTEVENCIAKIDELNEQLLCIKEQIVISSNQKRCNVCSSIIEDGSSFCPNCGTKI